MYTKSLYCSVTRYLSAVSLSAATSISAGSLVHVFY